MAEITTSQLIVRNTFLELVSEDAAKGFPRLRSRSDHCIDYADLGNDADDIHSDFGDSSTIACTSGVGSGSGTSRASSEVGSDDAASCDVMVSGPPGVFIAPGTCTTPGTTSCQAPAEAAVQTLPEDDGTTVIVRKIPRDVSRSEFLGTLDAEGFAGLYAFVYLPMNFQKGIGLGYAIINFVDASSAAAAAVRLPGVGLGDNRLEASISDTKQSLSDLVLRYRDSPVMHSSVPDDCKPLIFSDGLVVPFPEPTISLDPPVGSKAKGGAGRSA